MGSMEKRMTVGEKYRNRNGEFELGFRTGTGQDTERIERNVPNEYLDDFYQGWMDAADAKKATVMA